MRLTPINTAEAIIEPFWDGQLSGLKLWRVQPGPSHGLRVYQNWCWVGFDWARPPAKGPALHMSRELNVPCAGYDKLMVSSVLPEKSQLRLIAATDRGRIDQASSSSPAQKREFFFPLRGATKIHKMTLEVHTANQGVASGWFNWIGLQNSRELDSYLGFWSQFDERWEAHLKPKSYNPRFEPSLGILINSKELESLRARHSAFLKKRGNSPFIRAAQAARKLAPERMIRGYVNFWGDTRYCRERDDGNLLLRHGPSAAIAGLLMKDKRYLRLAARYAMSIAMCDRWDDGMICYFPGGNFDHRCFVQSLCAHETALVLDLAGEMFTETGRQYLLRRIAEHGLGNIHFNTWKYEYIFHCNQLAWFTPGRILGALTLEKFMPRVKPYTELAYQDLIQSLGYTIQPDGSYLEGPTYFRCVGRDAGLSLYYYARGRGLKFRSVIPEIMKRAGHFAEAVASTDESGDQIPVCDAMPRAEQETLAVMAALLPRSQWVTMFNKSLARSGGMADTILACQLQQDIPRKQPRPKPFTVLPEMGVITSVRQVERETVKLLLMGNKTGAGHTHEDKGSFVLEFAGETFGLDPGTCDYSSPMSNLVTHCERHNMLVPYGLDARPHPKNPLPVDVKPRGKGGRKKVHARIDATPGWEGFYKKWVRTWDSPLPDLLTIRDEYEIARGQGVEFYWNTRREVRVQGNTITLLGQRGQVVLEAPADCTVRVDVLALHQKDFQRRIAIRKEGKAGMLEVRVLLRLLH